jgi:DNA-binding response OmpR family regulator
MVYNRSVAHLLIIDDDHQVADLLCSYFSEEGHDVSLAYTGNDGLAQAVGDPPDVILLDVMLPDLTGFQMCGRFRQTMETKAIPILMMSGVARYPNQKDFAFERGANEYILKPFKILELGELVDRYIAAKRESRAVPMAKPIEQKPEKTTLDSVIERFPSPEPSLEQQPATDPMRIADLLSDLRAFLHQNPPQKPFEGPKP